jgi:hypothetical protein
MKMKALLLSVTAAVGITVLGMSSSIAAPAAGAALEKAMSGNELTQQVWWGGHRWHWRHGWGRGWCYYHPYRCHRW